jgi:hypothetical protein
MGSYRLAAAVVATAISACGLPLTGEGPFGESPDSGPSLDAAPDGASVVRPDGSTAPTGPTGPKDGGSADAPSPVVDGPTGGGACDANLSSDPAHCGSCDRDCAGGSCQSGSCLPAAIASSPDPIRAVGVSSSYIVWATVGSEIYRAALDGSGAQPIASATDSVSELVVAGTDIYYTTGDLHRITIDGASDTILVTGGADACLQISGTTAYVVAGSTVPVSIDAVDLTGGTRTPVVPAADLVLPWGVAVTAGDVYWSGNQHGDPDGGLWHLPLAGGSANEIVPHLANPNCLTVYGDALYWPNADDGTIMTSALDGSGSRVLATGQDTTYPPTTVAVDDRFVYWSSGSKIQRLAR